MQFLWRPEEDSGFPGTVVTDCFEPPHGKSRFFRRPPVLLTSRLILTHGFRGFSQKLLISMCLSRISMCLSRAYTCLWQRSFFSSWYIRTSKKRNNRKTWARYHPQDVVISGRCSSARPHLFSYRLPVKAIIVNLQVWLHSLGQSPRDLSQELLSQTHPPVLY